MAFMKASHLQANVESLALLPAAAQAEVRARVPRELAAIAALARNEWAPLELDLTLSTAILDVVGAEETRALNARALSQSADGPLLRPIRDAARRLLGNRPDAILRFVGQGWSAIFKDVGTASYLADADGHGGVVTAWDQPDVALNAAVWPIGCAGAFDGILDVVGAEGRFVGTTDRAARCVRFVGRWKQPAR